MFWLIFLLLTGLKLLLLTSYRSTDFEVHRNWLAITHTLPIDRWYVDSTSEWTLDYPPFFAYFEYLLSQFAQFFDSKMLNVESLNYESPNTILFQRLSVIASDIVFAIGVKKCLNCLGLKTSFQNLSGSVILLGNVGLIFVDHIHFQYNGFLLGILLLSICYSLERKYIKSAIVFATLLNFKHIFLYVVPAFGAYFLKFACIKSSKNFLLCFFQLLWSGAFVFVISFAPFYKQIPQVLSRLFPFKRGLTHSYWAPNFWAMYNSFDKLAGFVFRISPKGRSSTDGTVQEFNHVFLPTISPAVTFYLTSLFMIPCVIKIIFYCDEKNSRTDFLRAVVICSCTSYMFSWHVHEKAILMSLIPLCLLALINVEDAKYALLLSAVGYFSLFSLLFPKELFFVKNFLYLTYMLMIFYLLGRIYKSLTLRFNEIIYLLGFILLPIYEYIIGPHFDLDIKLPFLPLLLNSLYCSIGIMYIYFNYYYFFLTSSKINVSRHKVKSK